MRLLRKIWFRLVNGRDSADVARIAELEALLEELSIRTNAAEGKQAELGYEVRSLRAENTRIREEADAARREAMSALRTMANVAYGERYGFYPFPQSGLPESLRPVEGGTLPETQRIEDIYEEELRVARDEIEKFAAEYFSPGDVQ